MQLHRQLIHSLKYDVFFPSLTSTVISTGDKFERWALHIQAITKALRENWQMWKTRVISKMSPIFDSRNWNLCRKIKTKRTPAKVYILLVTVRVEKTPKSSVFSSISLSVSLPLRKRNSDYQEYIILHMGNFSWVSTFPWNCKELNLSDNIDESKSSWEKKVGFLVLQLQKLLGGRWVFFMIFYLFL